MIESNPRPRAWRETRVLLLSVCRLRDRFLSRQEGTSVQVRCLGDVLVLCSSLWERQREPTLQCHYSSTQASGNRSFLGWYSPAVAETALGAKDWQGTLLTANRQSHPGKSPGYKCPRVLMRNQHFSLSGWTLNPRAGISQKHIFHSKT